MQLWNEFQKGSPYASPRLIPSPPRAEAALWAQNRQEASRGDSWEGEAHFSLSELLFLP